MEHSTSQVMIEPNTGLKNDRILKLLIFQYERMVNNIYSKVCCDIKVLMGLQDDPSSCPRSMRISFPDQTYKFSPFRELIGKRIYIHAWESWGPFVWYARTCKWTLFVPHSLACTWWYWFRPIGLYCSNNYLTYMWDNYIRHKYLLIQG